MMMSVEETREYMRKMQETGRYHFYGESIDDIPDDQVADRYMTMMNFLSDARTHEY